MLKPFIDFNFGGLPIYNITGIIGLIFATSILLKKEKNMGLAPDFEEKINLSFISAALVGLACANIANWFLFPDVLDYPLLQRVALSGLSFYYGMIGFFVIAAFLLKLHKINVKFWINEIVPSVLIFHAFGRIGCSLAGCCYGIDITPINIFGLTIDHFPARELESLCLFIMFFIFRWAIKKYRLFWYLISYSIIRFILEFGRGDNRGYLITDKLSPAQITSIFVWSALLVCVISIIIKRKSLLGEDDSKLQIEAVSTEGAKITNSVAATFANQNPGEKRNYSSDF